MNDSDPSGMVSVAALTARMRGSPSVRLLDVRTPAEFEAAHIEGAYNVPLDTLGEHAAEIRAVVGTPLVLVCQSGQRARKAQEALRGGGIPELQVLEGGMNSWLATGDHVVRGTHRMSLERQVRIAAGGVAAVGATMALLVGPLFALVPAFVGFGLVFAGVTDTCAMGMLLARLPYNRPASDDIAEAVRALTAGAPSPTRRSTRSVVACRTN